jgi:hypothetical protein
MPPTGPVLLAVATLFVVAAGLFRQVLVTRAARRELDRYLQWLLECAAGPVSVALPYPWR